MKRSSGVRLGLPAAVGVLSLALVTGCSGGGSTGSGNAGGTDAAKPAARALSIAELKKLIIAAGEVPGYRVGPVSASRAEPIATGSAACRPLARVMSGLPPVDTAVRTDRMATENRTKRPTATPTSLEDMSEGDFEDALKVSLDRDVTTVSLSSYDGDGAARALTSVSDAVRACADGFSAQQGGDKVKFTKVAAERSIGAGDESVAFTAAMKSDGEAAPVHAEVDRHGTTLSVYFTVNLGAMMAKTAYVVSPAVVKAQEAKLK
ncbi:hypothetical protein [Streptomyces sp. AF1A]|jgi:hypothetical protein|uniref:hypothetical protein n=1 Tax=Streptomyces sp. AF1A TaxID=3394350 RepID=UPI0039BC9FDA